MITTFIGFGPIITHFIKCKPEWRGSVEGHKEQQQFLSSMLLNAVKFAVNSTWAFWFFYVILECNKEK